MELEVREKDQEEQDNLRARGQSGEGNAETFDKATKA